MDHDLFEEAVLDIADQINKSGDRYKYKQVFPVVTGGVTFAGRLAEVLGLPISHHVDSHTLVADDIIRGGETTYPYRARPIAVLYKTPDNNREYDVEPTYFFRETNERVEFWWEKRIQATRAEVKKRSRKVEE